MFNYKSTNSNLFSIFQVAIFTVIMTFNCTVYAMKDGNPLVTHMYTADPSARVFEGRVYVYPSHDLDDATRYNMKDYHVLSSANLIDWEDHGLALTVENVPWATRQMWAPDCIYKDGKYYFYFPARGEDKTFRIGVATSDSPAGPFIPEPSYIEGTDEIDPAAFIDDDGQAYLYWGGKSVSVAKLDSTMKQFVGDIVKPDGVKYFYEGAWMHKHNGTYYLSYSTGKFHPDTNDHLIAYSTSNSPLGPFEFGGIVNHNVSSITNHHSIVEFKGQWYLFYHNSDLSDGNNNRRSVVADYLHYNDDGSIRPVIQTQLGIGRYDGLAVIEAENYSETQNAHKQQNDNNGLHIVFAANDKIIFNNIMFGDKTMNAIELKISSEIAGGKIMVRSKTGNLLAEIDIPQTNIAQQDSSTQWQTLTSATLPLTGNNDISITYVDAASSSGQVIRIDNIQFLQKADK